MKYDWSLKTLYDSFEDEKFVADEAALDQAIAQYTKLTGDFSGDAVENLTRFLEAQIRVSELMTKLYVFAELRQAVNTSDAQAAAVLGRLAQKQSALAAPETHLIDYIATVPDFENVLRSSPLLSEHAYYLTLLREKKAHTLAPAVEEAISLYEISGSRAWSELHGYLTSTVPVAYKGETTNLSDIRNKAYDADSEVRKSAYEAELACYDRIRDGIAYSLNSIKMEVINRCRLRGYASPLEETLQEAHMKRETLDALLGAMEEYLPKFWEYLRAKAKLLGHENGLPWYDLFAPLQGNDKKFTIEECRDYLVKLFSGFDEEEADLIQTAFDNEWIDFMPKNGKVGGAFCEDIHPLGESRILTNYDGGLGDVVTLAHELGHAFHNHCLKGNSILNTMATMPVAETASTFNEVVAMNAAIGAESDPKVRRALIESQLMDATQIICDIYSRYLFESAVFERRADEFLFADDLCAIMLQTQKKAYGTGLDESCLHPYMWACKSHYYSGIESFYNFPYAFGGLFALGLYAMYRKDGAAFVPLYKKLLKATGSSSVEDAALVAGIDITKKEFWRASLQMFAEEIDEFIALCE